MDLWLQNIKHTRVCIRKCHFRWIIYERAFKYSSRLLWPEKYLNWEGHPRILVLNGETPNWKGSSKKEGGR